MRILKLASYYEPEQISSSHLSRDLEEGYIRNGYEIVIYAPVPTRGISQNTRNKYKKIKHEEKFNGKIKIYRFFMFKEGKNTIFRALRYLAVNFVQYFKGIHAKDIDVIFAGSTPPTQGMLCAMVKNKLCKKYNKHVPLVFNLQDIFPDSLVNAKMTNKGSWIWNIGRKIEDYTYQNCDAIIVISEDFKNNIVNKGVPEEKIVVVPNWINTDNVYPVKRKDNILFDRYGLDRSNYYICYSGNIGHSQNMRLLLDTAKELKEKYSNLYFVLIGEGAAKEKVEQIIRMEKIENVIMLPFQPYEDIAHVFSLGDVGLIISKPGIGGSSVPSKTWSILAAERPILASFDKDSELCKLIDKVECGVTAQAGSIEELKDNIIKLYCNKKNANTMGKKGREYIRTELNKDKCVEMYVDTIRRTILEE